MRAIGAGKRRGGRFPRQQQPNGIRMEYWKALRNIAKQPGGPKARDVAEAATVYGKRAGRFQWVQLDRQVRSALGVSLGAVERPVPDPIPDFVEENVELVAGAWDRYEDRLEFEEATPDFDESGLVPAVDLLESALWVIAADQVGKLFADYNQERQSGMGIEGYTWRAYDPCEECAPYDGEVFQWDNPPPQGHPSEVHPRCMCEAEPLFDRVMAGLAFEDEESGDQI
jgi:hypothetical protein